MDYADNPLSPAAPVLVRADDLVDYLGNYNTNKLLVAGQRPRGPGLGLQGRHPDGHRRHQEQPPQRLHRHDLLQHAARTPTDTATASTTAPSCRWAATTSSSRTRCGSRPRTVTGGATEITPYDADFDNVPRAKGGTAPGMGFMIAYNLLSSSTTNLRTYAQPQPHLPRQRRRPGPQGRQPPRSSSRPTARPTPAPTPPSAGSGKRRLLPDPHQEPRQHRPTHATSNGPTGGTYADTEVYDVVKQICARTPPTRRLLDRRASRPRSTPSATARCSTRPTPAPPRPTP